MVRREAMLELGVKRFVQSVAQIVDPAEETLTYEPRLLDGIPFLLHLLARVGGGQVRDGWIVSRWLRRKKHVLRRFRISGMKLTSRTC